MSVTRGREAAFFFSNYRIRVLRFLYGTLLSAYEKGLNLGFFGRNLAFVDKLKFWAQIEAKSLFCKV